LHKSSGAFQIGLKPFLQKYLLLLVIWQINYLPERKEQSSNKGLLNNAATTGATLIALLGYFQL
jgi:hypothetical protein